MTLWATTGATTIANSNENSSFSIFIVITVIWRCYHGDSKRPPHVSRCRDGWKAEDSWWIRRVIKGVGGRRWTGAGHVFSVTAAKPQNALQVRRVVSADLSACLFSLRVHAAPNADGAWQSEIEELGNFCGESCQLFTLRRLSGLSW